VCMVCLWFVKVHGWVHVMCMVCAGSVQCLCLVCAWSVCAYAICTWLVYGDVHYL
jgi:hypothetical protein